MTKAKDNQAMIQWETEKDEEGYTVHHGIILGQRVYRIERLGDRWDGYWFLRYWGYPITHGARSGFTYHREVIRDLKHQADKHAREHILPTLTRALETIKARPGEDRDIIRLPEAKP